MNPDPTRMDDAAYREYVKSLPDHDLMQMIEFINPQSHPGRFEAVAAELLARGLLDSGVTLEELQARQGERLVREYATYTKWKLLVGIVILLIAGAIATIRLISGSPAP